MRPAFNKYHAERIEVDGILFHSKKEARYYQALKARKDKGEIKNFRLQVSYELIPTQYIEVSRPNKKGVMEVKRMVAERPCTYTADFVVEYPDGSIEVIDVKGLKLADYKIKRKLMRWIHQLSIQEV